MKLTRLAATGAALCLLASACSAGSSSSPGASSGGGSGGDTTLSVGLVAEPASLDFTTTDGAAIPQALLYNVYETLVKLDQEGKIVPCPGEEVDRLRRPQDLHLRPRRQRHLHQRAEVHRRGRGVSRINRVKKDWTISLKSAMDVVKDAKARLAHPASGDPGQAEQRLALPDDHPGGRDDDRAGVDKLATEPVGTGPYTLDEVEPRRLDRADPQRQLLRQEAVLPDRHAEVLQGPHGPQQRAADRHHRRHRHRAGSGVARPVLQATTSSR